MQALKFELEHAAWVNTRPWPESHLHMLCVMQIFALWLEHLAPQLAVLCFYPSLSTEQLAI